MNEISLNFVYSRIINVTEHYLIFLGMAAMLFPLWCSFDIEEDSLAESIKPFLKMVLY